MKAFFKSRPVRVARAIVRWLRILALLLVFLAVFTGVYLHEFGLPDFAKRALLQRLRDHGLDAQFTSMRLGWGQGVIIENVTFSRLNHPFDPKLAAAEAKLIIDFPALARRQLLVRSAQITEGSLRLTLAESNSPFLTLDHLKIRLDFLTNDVVQLTDARASFRGLNLHLEGALTNASAIRDWKSLAEPATNHLWQTQLRKWVDTMDRIHFLSPPQLDATLTADARAPDQLNAMFQVATDGAVTPWGSASNVSFLAQGRPLDTNAAGPFAACQLDADNLSTPQGRADGIAFRASFLREAGDTHQYSCTLLLAATNLETTALWPTNRFALHGVDFNGFLTFQSTNPVQLKASGTLTAQRAITTWGSARTVGVAFHWSPNPRPLLADTNWGNWARLEPFLCDAQVDLSRVESPQLSLDHLQFTADWSAPNLTLTKTEASLYQGRIETAGQLDVATRQTTVQGLLDFDVLRLRPLFTPDGQRWLDQFTWKQPPRVRFDMRATLPAWSHRHPDWNEEVAPTLLITGSFTATNGTFREIPVVAAESTFSYSNHCWNLPRLHAAHANGEILMDYFCNDRTHDYRFVFDSRLDPQVVRHLVPLPQRNIVDDFKFNLPPLAHTEVDGRWQDPSRINVATTVSATNFTFRGVRVDTVAGWIGYNNRVIDVTNATLTQGGGRMNVAWFQARFPTNGPYRFAFSNAFSNLNPSEARKLLGTNADDVLGEVTFNRPPEVRGGGSFVLHDPQATDLQLHIEGGPYHWTNLLADHISGDMRVMGRSILLTNIDASLYGRGKVSGWVALDYQTNDTGEFRLRLEARDIDLALAVHQISGKTNHVEGLLNGSLAISSGHTRDPATWNGAGQASLRDGLIWDIPIFGIFSPVLNMISPGAGNSRAREANLTFVVTNGLADSEDLQVVSPLIRLNYRGHIDLNRKTIDGRVQAELLRDPSVVERMVNFAFAPFSKLFEYKVTGPLSKPVSEPVFIPSLFLKLLRPFHTLRTMLPEATTTSTNAPAPVKDSK